MKEKSKNLSLLFITVVIIGFLIYSVVDHFNTIDNNAKKIEFTSKRDLYLNLIDEGDSLLNKKDWQDAIYNYQKAYDLFPKEYDINYRLVAAYSYRCNDEFIDCKEAKKLLDKILNEYPNKAELLELKTSLEFEYQTN
ncbi:tetratricopeptide repeat protein [Cellulophaga baltica]|uniref:tetratricopeptide repeat protein n=1 Tax=Cellulophaga TaxID=104264 RepID=UPI001C06C180|nr:MULTISPECIES: tetratricopeptide repeat protein [Cellulophaga]MBU2997885.1 tetratricopeptide repeat protein [Cellulophaga baltica]MDO6769286.1 tetratricopeptide repeat protein [Cellulophaga sp. 1_MG-2023]